MYFAAKSHGSASEEPVKTPILLAFGKLIITARGGRPASQGLSGPNSSS